MKLNREQEKEVSRITEEIKSRRKFARKLPKILKNKDWHKRLAEK